MVCDPNFLVNRYVYVIYIQNPVYGAVDVPAYQATQGVVVRYTDINGVADPNSRTALVGKDPWTGFVVCGNSHSVGDLAFGHDGTLFAGSGDGGHWEWDDDGTDRTAYVES